MRRAWWVVALGSALVTGCGLTVPNPPKTLPPTLDANTLPPAAVAALDHKWPRKDWQRATLDPQVASCLPATVPPKTVVTSDFDSDGMSDIALAVSTSKGTRLVVLMARTYGYELFDVDALGDKAAGLALGIDPRGKRFVNADTTGVDNYSSDSIAAIGCANAHFSYLWSGFDFYKVKVGDAKAAVKTARRATPFLN